MMVTKTSKIRLQNSTLRVVTSVIVIHRQRRVLQYQICNEHNVENRTNPHLAGANRNTTGSSRAQLSMWFRGLPRGKFCNPETHCISETAKDLSEILAGQSSLQKKLTRSYNLHCLSVTLDVRHLRHNVLVHNVHNWDIMAIRHGNMKVLRSKWFKDVYQVTEIVDGNAGVGQIHHRMDWDEDQ